MALTGNGSRLRATAALTLALLAGAAQAGAAQAKKDGAKAKVAAGAAESAVIARYRDLCRSGAPEFEAAAAKFRLPPSRVRAASADWRRDAQKCRRIASLDTLEKLIGSPIKDDPPALTLWRKKMPEAKLREPLCWALAKRDPSCVGGRDRQCAQFATGLLFLGAALRGEPVKPFCGGVEERKNYRPADWDQACELIASIIRTRRDEQGACRKLAGLLADPRAADSFAKSCPARLLVVESCAKDPMRDLCRVDAAIWKAAASGNPKLCDGSVECEAYLARSPERCLAMLDGYVSGYCSDQERAIASFCAARTKPLLRFFRVEEAQFRMKRSLPPYRPGDPMYSQMTPADRGALGLPPHLAE